ncbi:MAG: metallophosphoesterase [Chlamydiia bacterium]|nr:metallophosphoesterase [Chlamydiia bacterium]
MKTLVIADLHNKVHWVEECIEAESPDLVVFLGDYFDSFDETEEAVVATAKWLKESASRPGRVHLMGNHDMPYRFPSNMNLFCPGFTYEKWELICEVFGEEDVWKEFKAFHFIGGYLLSHAGVHLNLLHPILGFDLKQLKKDEEEAFLRCTAGESIPFFGCGRSRGGNYRIGGITWQDFDRDFVPIKGVNQIVGHTPHPQVRAQCLLDDEEVVECTWDAYLGMGNSKELKSLNIALDTHRKYYALIVNGKVQIKENQFANQMDFSQ